nr:fibronectin type III domain-containing protein [Tumebacillus amylolyticus]
MPTGLIDTANGDGTVSLKWTPQLGITGYNIYQDYQDETSVPVKTIPVGTTTATLTGLENNRVYRYRISAVNAVGESAKTADIIAMPYSATQWVNPTMTSNTAPSGIVTTSVAPANGFKLFDHNGNGTSWAGADTKPVTIDYDFQTPTIVKEYTLYTYAGAYSTSAPKNWTFEGFDGSKWVVLDTQSNVSDWATYTTKYFTTTNTTPYNKYRLNMTDNNGNLVNNVPNYQLFEVVLLGSYDIPAMPTGLMNTSNGDGTVSLKWTPQLGITNYNIYQDDGNVPVKTIPVGTTTATLIGLENNRVYHYRISAVNAVAESSKSSEVIAMPYNATQWVNPTMTSNTAPSGIVTTSVAPTNGYKLFDHNGNGTNWIGSAATPVTIDYDFQTPTVVKEYTLFTYAGAYSTSAPKDWTFEGFDGTQWVVLDTQTNVTDWATYVTKYFTTSNTTPYTKYRLNMTANNGNANFQLYEVQLLGNH